MNSSNDPELGKCSTTRRNVFIHGVFLFTSDSPIPTKSLNRSFGPNTPLKAIRHGMIEVHFFLNTPRNTHQLKFTHWKICLAVELANQKHKQFLLLMFFHVTFFSTAFKIMSPTHIPIFLLSFSFPAVAAANAKIPLLLLLLLYPTLTNHHYIDERK